MSDEPTQPVEVEAPSVPPDEPGIQSFAHTDYETIMAALQAELTDPQLRPFFARIASQMAGSELTGEKIAEIFIDALEREIVFDDKYTTHHIRDAMMRFMGTTITSKKVLGTAAAALVTGGFFAIRRLRR